MDAHEPMAIGLEEIVFGLEYLASRGGLAGRHELPSADPGELAREMLAAQPTVVVADPTDPNQLRLVYRGWRYLNEPALVNAMRQLGAVICGDRKVVIDRVAVTERAGVAEDWAERAWEGLLAENVVTTRGDDLIVDPNYAFDPKWWQRRIAQTECDQTLWTRAEYRARRERDRHLSPDARVHEFMHEHGLCTVDHGAEGLTDRDEPLPPETERDSASGDNVDQPAALESTCPVPNGDASPDEGAPAEDGAATISRVPRFAMLKNNEALRALAKEFMRDQGVTDVDQLGALILASGEGFARPQDVEDWELVRKGAHATSRRNLQKRMSEWKDDLDVAEVRPRLSATADDVGA